jgi:pyruvate kinase
MRFTKIMATIGPASCSEEILTRLVSAGMNVARINFAYGTHKEHKETIQHLRKVSRALDMPVAVLTDLAGPKIRVGPLEGGTIELREGETLRISRKGTPGTTKEISTTYAGLISDLKRGQTILFDEGELEAKVTRKTKKYLFTRVIRGGVLKENRGVNVPGATLSIPSVTEKDRKDLRWATKEKVEYIGVSFVRSPQDIRLVKRLIRKQGSSARIIAKIEKPEALKDLEEIIRLSDAVMVARGDLGVEMDVAEVPLVQKRIIRLCSRLDKPSIVATQMLQSMVESPQPTRAEVSDVAGAVFDGADALMLSAETAIGKYPVKAVQIAAKVIEKADQYQREIDARPIELVIDPEYFAADAVSHGAYQIAHDAGARLVVISSQSGATALFFSKYRFYLPAIAISDDPGAVARMSLYWGITPIYLRGAKTPEELLHSAEKVAATNGWLKKDDLIVLVAGTPLGKAGTTDTIKLYRAKLDFQKKTRARKKRRRHK